MSVNSSSSSSSLNSSHPPFPFLPPSIYQVQMCLSSTSVYYTLISFTIISCLVVLPLCILVIHQGLQRQRQQRSNMTTNHSDRFTYHMAAIEILGILGSIIIVCGTKTGLPLLMTVGTDFVFINSTGQTLFQFLTCVERYLAVVHPITYRSLREGRGIRIRDIAIGCCWLLCFAATLVTHIRGPVPIFFFTLTIASYLAVFLFLSLSVLCALKGPDPGRVVGTKGKVDQLKLRAFYNFMAIFGVLLLRFGGHMILTIFSISSYLGKTRPCVSLLCVIWFGLPSSLILPLLYLHRAGTLQCCKSNNNQSGECTD